jgi:uncharacterized protein
MKKKILYLARLFFLLALGFLVFVVFSHMRPMLNGKADLIGRIGLCAVLLLSALLTLGSEQARRYSRVLFAFFIASVAISVDYYVPSQQWLLSFLRISGNSPAGIALEKLESSAIIIGIILLLTKLSRESLASVYVRKGKVLKSLAIGAVAFVISATGSVFAAGLFGARGVTIEKALPWIPWILIFIFGNALNEELLFRGLFLRKMEPLTGKVFANLIITIPFVFHHTGVSYTGNELMFLAILLPLSLAWGAITQNTDSLWGSVLFHAGTDIPVVLAVFSNL